ncbi:hypothetical protein ACYCFL_07700 [Stutzerimonas nitrititolerans]|uniref:hypothetical protein n=1 Tax=Stutzerimonas nitrititolerans TaxID=2482751 RepID=UPI00289B3BB9|nr:hypothetical protein [Stutzerimonas nitrititolerans]
MTITERLLWLLRKIPVIDGLADIEWQHFSDAVKEVFFTVLLSTTPLWLGALVASLIDVSTASSGSIFSTFLENLSASTKNGALIIYSAALIAPVIYIAATDVRTNSRNQVFPSRPWHILFAFFIQVIGSSYFVIQSLGKQMNEEYSYTLSAWLFPITLLMLLIAFCYKNLILDINPTREMEQSENNFRSGYSRHRRVVE